ncbi:hypothetical protein N7516_001494 [Penicillium verrucosum]|uniref:uncharacterized protein n=1 Tax=Penicillium verrucosum TaxID=60171 RepID=UPI00254555CA|nr:uncharacterized protein N7516_001494 [Penicillium verrucosum]KAJ5941326.1 hypothetical protein N7516_001494 [Penicillium verrucosum]
MVTSGVVYPGVSIGIHDTYTSAGTSTLGGLVQLQLPSESRWRTYGLTCFYAVWPPEENRSKRMLQIAGAETALSNWEYGLRPPQTRTPTLRYCQKDLES